MLIFLIDRSIYLILNKVYVLNGQVLCIRKPDEPIDLFMVEIMHMRHKFDVDTRLVCMIFPWINFVIIYYLFLIRLKYLMSFDLLD